MKALIFTLLVILTINLVSLSADSDDQVFISESHDFSVQYPRSWNRAEAVHPQTVIRVESPDGDDFNITVVQDPSLRDMSPDQYANGMLDQVDNLVTNVLSQNYPDAKLIKKGITQLSQQPAIFYMMDYTLSAAGRDIAMRSYAISTKNGDKQYTLTFRTPQQFFSEYLPVIQRIALGFQLTKTRIR